MAKADFALIGDSHAGAIGQTARAQGLSFCGGPLASGREFYQNFFEVTDLGIKFTASDTEEMHQELCQLLGVANLSRLDLPVLSTIGSGFHVPATQALWSAFINSSGEFEHGFLESELFSEIADRQFGPALAFHEYLISCGIAVKFVVPPQRVPQTSLPTLMLRFQQRALTALTAAGCGIVDTRSQTTGADGWQQPAFCQENDPVHANQAYGTEVLKCAGYLA